MEHIFLPSQAVVVIFAGGEGKRLWPVSTETMPKQMNPAFSKETLIEEAFNRAATIVPKENIVIVVTEILAENAKKLINLPEKNWIIQPKNADTAVAMCLTALHLETLFPESTAVLFYSDHRITHTKQFNADIKRALKLAQTYPSVITIGTKVLYPNTQFGYIKLGKKEAENFYVVDAFKEKPDEQTALAYMKSKHYVWNTGVYVWQTAVLLQAVKEVSPEIYHELLDLKLTIGTKEYKPALEKWFEKTKPVSFDKAISEKLSTLYVYVGNYDWTDVGNWKAFYEISDKDEQGNAIVNPVPKQNIHLIETTNSLVFSHKKEIALVGLTNIIVVETDGALLICSKDHVAKVKDVLQK